MQSARSQYFLQTGGYFILTRRIRIRKAQSNIASTGKVIAIAQGGGLTARSRIVTAQSGGLTTRSEIVIAQSGILTTRSGIDTAQSGGLTTRSEIVTANKDSAKRGALLQFCGKELAQLGANLVYILFYKVRADMRGARNEKKLLVCGRSSLGKCFFAHITTIGDRTCYIIYLYHYIVYIYPYLIIYSSPLRGIVTTFPCFTAPYLLIKPFYWILSSLYPCLSPPHPIFSRDSLYLQCCNNIFTAL